jgi:hypothetical protein
MHGKGDHLQGEVIICTERGTICRERGPFEGRGDRLLDKATSGYGARPVCEGSSARGENNMHGMRNHLQGEGVICIERGTICRERGPFEGRGTVCWIGLPAGGTRAICEGRNHMQGEGTICME